MCPTFVPVIFCHSPEIQILSTSNMFQKGEFESGKILVKSFFPVFRKILHENTKSEYKKHVPVIIKCSSSRQTDAWKFSEP